MFCKKAGGVGVNAVKHYLRRLRLVSIATILSKTLKIQFLFLSAIPHNWSFFTIFKQTFWSILGYHSTLSRPGNLDHPPPEFLGYFPSVSRFFSAMSRNHRVFLGKISTCPDSRRNLQIPGTILALSRNSVC